MTETEAQKCPIDFSYHGPHLDEVFETYKRMREECPVGQSPRYGGFTYLSKYEDVYDAEQDHQTFSVKPTMLLPGLGNETPMIPIDLDQPEHTGYRRMLLPLFTPKAIDELAPQIVEVAQQLITDMEPVDGVVDIAYAFARPLPVIIFSILAGFPQEDWPKFDKWIDEILYERTEKPEVAVRASSDLYDYFDELLNRRRNEPEKQDIISLLLNSELEGRPLTQAELQSYCYLLFLAGLDTTAWAIRSSLWHLAQHPEDQEMLRNDPDAVPLAVEEFLRTMSPVQAMARTTTREVEVGGVSIPKGERIVLSYGAANRDPEAFEQAEEMILDREPNRHLSFGVGIHRCLGSNLGRREVVVALQELLRLMPSFEMAQPDQVWHGVGSLHLRFAGKGAE